MGTKIGDGQIGGVPLMKGNAVNIKYWVLVTHKVLVALSEKKGFGYGLIRFILVILSWVYQSAVVLRMCGYRIGLLPVHTLKVPVISMGNITAGGTGKTPAVVSAAKLFLAEGYKPVILTRGYGRKTKNTLVVSDGKELKASLSEAGDEPVSMAQECRNVPIIADSKRFRGGAVAIEKFNPDVILLDDGFQHVSLTRNINIVLIDCLMPWGRGRCLPAGFLREPKSSIKRADMIILTRSNLVSAEQKQKIEQELQALNSFASILESTHAPVKLTRLTRKEEKDIAWLHNKNVVVVAGIGNMQAFIRTVENAGAEVVKIFSFPDHHQFNHQEISSVISFAREKDFPVITTGKDAVRISVMKPAWEDFFVLDIAFTITRGYDTWKKTLLGLVQ